MWREKNDTGAAPAIGARPRASALATVQSARVPILPVIMGPTASGKTDLAIAIALRLPEVGRGAGEILTADSMQVYRGMDIGTAKPTPAQRAAVPHHLLDLREPTAAFSVEEWLRLAEAAIAEIRARGRTPIVVGGSHLYIKALLEGLFEGPPPERSLRAELTAMDAAARRAELERVDPATAARIHANDVRRTVRALEVHRQTGRPISEWQRQWDSGGARADAALITLRWEAPALACRINDRVRAMRSAGLVEEVWRLWAADRLGRQAREGLGYKQLAEAFERAGTPSAGPAPAAGDARLDDAFERIKTQTRRFAKNQRTWLRRIAAATPAERRLDIDAEAMEPAGGAAIALEWIESRLDK